MMDTSSGGWEFATGAALDSFVPQTDAYPEGTCCTWSRSFGNSIESKLQLQVMWNQLEGAW